MNRLRYVRKQKGLTLAKVAEDTGVSISNLSRYESADVEPRRETWIKLADYYCVPVSYLMGLPSGLVEYIDQLGYLNFEKLHEFIIQWAEDRKIMDICQLVWLTKNTSYENVGGIFLRKNTIDS